MKTIAFKTTLDDAPYEGIGEVISDFKEQYKEEVVSDGYFVRDPKNGMTLFGKFSKTAQQFTMLIDFLVSKYRTDALAELWKKLNDHDRKLVSLYTQRIHNLTAMPLDEKFLFVTRDEVVEEVEI